MKFLKMLKAAALLSAAGSSALLSGYAVGQTAEVNGMKAGGHEYLLTMSRPNQLHVIDTETKKLLHSCDVPGTFGAGAVLPSPDGRIAYVLSNKVEDVYGFDITDCTMVFSAKQSQNGERVKTFVSLAISGDGKELYTVQNPTRKLADRYEVLAPRLAVFNTEDGLDAKSVRTFPVDRRITKIMTMKNGEVILGGADIKAINPENGETRVLSALQNWARGADWIPPDAFAMFTQGSILNSFFWMMCPTINILSLIWNGIFRKMNTSAINCHFFSIGINTYYWALYSDRYILFPTSPYCILHKIVEDEISGTPLVNPIKLVGEITRRRISHTEDKFWILL